MNSKLDKVKYGVISTSYLLDMSKTSFMIKEFRKKTF